MTILEKEASKRDRLMQDLPEAPIGTDDHAHAPVARRVALAFLLSLPLAACGVKGPPEPPPDADPKAPRRYPTR